MSTRCLSAKMLRRPRRNLRNMRFFVVQRGLLGHFAPLCTCVFSETDGGVENDGRNIGIFRLHTEKSEG